MLALDSASLSVSNLWICDRFLPQWAGDNKLTSEAELMKEFSSIPYKRSVIKLRLQPQSGNKEIGSMERVLDVSVTLPPALRSIY